MDISPENFVSIDGILADVLKVVKDGSTKLNSKGWYTSQIQQALEELSFDTFFAEHNSSFDVPSNLRLNMPKGAFNLRAIYAFNGDHCVIANSQRLYSKRNFINSDSGVGYVAADKYFNGNDQFVKNRGASTSDSNNRPTGVNYYSIQNGMIMLSESCLNFQKIMLVYNGIMTDIGEAPIVPQFFRQAVKDYVTILALETKMTDTIGTNEYNHWANLKYSYEGKMNHPYDGSWIKAERRSKQMNNAERRDIKTYMSRLNF